MKYTPSNKIYHIYTKLCFNINCCYFNNKEYHNSIYINNLLDTSLGIKLKILKNALIVTCKKTENFVFQLNILEICEEKYINDTIIRNYADFKVFWKMKHWWCKAAKLQSWMIFRQSKVKMWPLRKIIPRFKSS